MNDIATVELETSTPLFLIVLPANRTTGSFIIIDPLTNATLGAGMIQSPLQETLIKEALIKDALIRLRLYRALNPRCKYRTYQRHGHYPAIFSPPNQRWRSSLNARFLKQGLKPLCGCRRSLSSFRKRFLGHPLRNRVCGDLRKPIPETGRASGVGSHGRRPLLDLDTLNVDAEEALIARCRCCCWLNRCVIANE